MNNHKLPTEVYIKLEYSPESGEDIKVSRFVPTTDFKKLMPPKGNEVVINDNGCVVMSRETLNNLLGVE